MTKHGKNMEKHGKKTTTIECGIQIKWKNNDILVVDYSRIIFTPVV